MEHVMVYVMLHMMVCDGLGDGLCYFDFDWLMDVWMNEWALVAVELLSWLKTPKKDIFNTPKSPQIVPYDLQSLCTLQCLFWLDLHSLYDLQASEVETLLTKSDGPWVLFQLSWLVLLPDFLYFDWTEPSQSRQINNYLRNCRDADK